MSRLQEENIRKKFEEIFEILEFEKEHAKKTALRLAKIYLEEIFAPLTPFPSLDLYPQEGAKGQLIFHHKVPIHTFCAHHLVPMIGHAEIAYLPLSDSVLGFSKIQELVTFLCQRPNLQEKLTFDIYSHLFSTLKTEDIAIHTKLMHTCIAQKKKNVDEGIVSSYYFSGIFKKESYQSHFFLKS